MKILSRQSVKTLGRKAVCKLGWHENRSWGSRHAPAEYRRNRVRSARTKENHCLRRHVQLGEFENYEPLNVAHRDADWLFF